MYDKNDKGIIDAIIFCLTKIGNDGRNKKVKEILLECLNYLPNRYYILREPGYVRDRIEYVRENVFKSMNQHCDSVHTEYGLENIVISVEPMLGENYETDNFWVILNNRLRELRRKLDNNEHYNKELNSIKEYITDVKYYTLGHINLNWAVIASDCFSIKCNYWNPEYGGAKAVEIYTKSILENYQTICACKRFMSKVKEIESKLNV